MAFLRGGMGRRFGGEQGNPAGTPQPEAQTPGAFQPGMGPRGMRARMMQRFNQGQEQQPGMQPGAAMPGGFGSLRSRYMNRFNNPQNPQNPGMTNVPPNNQGPL